MQVRFGPFEVDEASGKLLKHGLPIPLREQPFQILLALLERPGELVTRQELHRRLWHERTLVDFELGLNTAISRLGHALNDPADSPRFIETVPKRGYRLMIPIPRQPSVAVMPLINDSPEPDSGYFSEGLTDALIGAISRIEGIKVAGRSAVARFRGQNYVPQHAAQALGVDLLLEGSVRKVADRIRININLLNAKDGFHLWSDRFDGDWKDIFAIQDRVAERTAEALKLRLAGPPISRPRNPEAHTAYLRGHYLVKRQSPSDLEQALRYFNESIQLDSGYATAYHGAAVVHILSALMGTSQPRQAFADADALLDQGLNLDKKSAMLQTTLAMLRMFQWRWSEAACAYSLALALEPANPHVHMTFSLLHTFLGNHEAAIEEAQTALMLDPVDPMMNFRMIQCFYYARQYEAVVRSSRTAIDLAPGFAGIHGYLAWALLALGRSAEAWTAAQQAKQFAAGRPLSEGQFGYVAGMLGHVDDAREVIDRLTNLRNCGYGPSLPIAWTWLGLGDIYRCVEWLEAAYEEQEPFVASVGVFLAYDPVRDHPRFREILRRIRLT